MNKLIKCSIIKIKIYYTFYKKKNQRLSPVCANAIYANMVVEKAEIKKIKFIYCHYYVFFAIIIGIARRRLQTVT